MLRKGRGDSTSPEQTWLLYSSHFLKKIENNFDDPIFCSKECRDLFDELNGWVIMSIDLTDLAQETQKRGLFWMVGRTSVAHQCKIWGTIT